MESNNKAEIIQFLRANGSETVQNRMNEKNGESFCASYIEAQMDEHSVTIEVALGWLEQDLKEY